MHTPQLDDQQLLSNHDLKSMTDDLVNFYDAKDEIFDLLEIIVDAHPHVNFPDIVWRPLHQYLKWKGLSNYKGELPRLVRRGRSTRSLGIVTDILHKNEELAFWKKCLLTLDLSNDVGRHLVETRESGYLEVRPYISAVLELLEQAQSEKNEWMICNLVELLGNWGIYNAQKHNPTVFDEFIQYILAIEPFTGKKLFASEITTVKISLFGRSETKLKPVIDNVRHNRCSFFFQLNAIEEYEGFFLKTARDPRYGPLRLYCFELLMLFMLGRGRERRTHARNLFDNEYNKGSNKNERLIEAFAEYAFERPWYQTQAPPRRRAWKNPKDDKNLWFDTESKSFRRDSPIDLIDAVSTKFDELSRLLASLSEQPILPPVETILVHLNRDERHYIEQAIRHLGNLTTREKDCFELVGQSYSNKEIADRLSLTPGSARNLLANVWDRLIHEEADTGTEIDKRALLAKTYLIHKFSESR